MQLQSVMPDITGKRANVGLFEPDPATGGDSINLSFHLNLTGSETLDQVNAMAKARAKRLLQDAIAVL